MKTSKKTSVKKTSVSPVLALVAHLISGVSLCKQGWTLPGSPAAIMDFPIYGGGFWSFQVVSLPLKLDVTLLTLETDPQFAALTPKSSWKLHCFTSLKSQAPLWCTLVSETQTWVPGAVCGTPTATEWWLDARPDAQAISYSPKHQVLTYVRSFIPGWTLHDFHLAPFTASTLKKHKVFIRKNRCL